MSVTTIDSGVSSPPAPSATPVVRVWPAVVLLSAYWGAVLFIHETDMAMLPRFLSRCIAWLATVLLFLGWWSLNRRVGWRDRLGAVVWLIASVVGTCLLSHPSFIAAVILLGIPAAFTAWTLWLALSRHWPPRSRRIGFAVILPLTLSFYLLFRAEGIDGAQRMSFLWRWTPSAEELFLASNSKPVEAPVEISHHWSIRPDDWPEFRGSRRDGVVKGDSFPTDWQTNPPKLIWRERVGPGWSSMSVVDGFLFTQEQVGEAEAIVCCDAATGKRIWSHTSPSRFNEPVSGAGPRATPTFHEGRIYAFGANGLLTCVSADKGTLIWSKSVKESTGAKTPQWGYSTSPLVVDDLVIMFAGGNRGRSVVAYRTDNGDEVWARGHEALSYSSPQFVELHGQQQILMLDNKALVGINPKDGTKLWERTTENAVEDAIIQPHLLDDQSLLISSGSGIARIDVRCADQQWTVSDRWVSNHLKPDFNDVTIHDGQIYGLDDGILCCVDLETGKRHWKRGRYGHGQILLLEDQARLLVACESGEIALVAATPDRFEELYRFQAIEGKLWNHPVIAEGRLFVRNGEEMACFDLRADPKTP